MIKKSVFYSYIKFIAKGHLHCNEPFSKGAQSHHPVHVLTLVLVLGEKKFIFPKTYTNSYICKRGWKEDPENDRPVRLTSTSGKVLIEQILVCANMRLDKRGSGGTRMGGGKTGSAWLVTF